MDTNQQAAHQQTGAGQAHVGQAHVGKTAAGQIETGQTRLRIDLAYDGTDFHGWARQKAQPQAQSQPQSQHPQPQHGSTELRTVQGILEDALSLVLRAPVQLTVAGRTDAGVHAAGQVCHVDVPLVSLQQRSIDGEPHKLVRRLSRLLPEDIRINAVEFAPAGFDARFSALRRHYEYRVSAHPGGVLPTRARDTAAWAAPVDFSAMQDAADALVGFHDFAAFCKAKPNATTVRDLQVFRWMDVSSATEPATYLAHVVADAFCWSMVRSLVGTCLQVGAGKREVDFAAALLGQSSRSSKIQVAPANGLSLVRVDYPADTELAARATETRQRRSL